MKAQVTFKYEKALIASAILVLAVLFSGCQSRNDIDCDQDNNTQAQSNSETVLPVADLSDMSDADRIILAFEQYYSRDEAENIAAGFIDLYTEACNCVINTHLPEQFKITEAKLIPFQSYIFYEQVAIPYSLQLADSNGHSLIVSAVDPYSDCVEGTVEMDGMPAYQRSLVSQAMAVEEYMQKYWSDSEVELIQSALEASESEGANEMDASTYYKTILLSLYYDNKDYARIISAEVIPAPESMIPRGERNTLHFAVVVLDNANNTIMVYQSAKDKRASYICVQQNGKTIRSLYAWKTIEVVIHPG